MGRPVVLSLTTTTAATGISLSQTPGAAGNLTITGSLASAGVATLSPPQRVAITSAGNDSGRTFTVYGTDRNGVTISEAVTGANVGVAYTVYDYATVTRIAVDAATAGAVTAGTNGIGSTTWIPCDVNVRTKFEASVVGQIISGTPTWQVDVTFDDVFMTMLPSNVTLPRAIPWANLVGKTGEAYDVISQPVRGIRLTITAIGGVQLTCTSQGD